jgi:hypothetical protein
MDKNYEYVLRFNVKIDYFAQIDYYRLFQYFRTLKPQNSFKKGHIIYIHCTICKFSDKLAAHSLDNRKNSPVSTRFDAFLTINLALRCYIRFFIRPLHFLEGETRFNER